MNKTSTTKAKPTAGPTIVEYQQSEHGTQVCVAKENGDWIADCGPAGIEESEENAKLFSEALNVHHETKLTPRELVERIKELEKELGREEL